mmetsp:Transcript_101702/g.242538  ORF Transcript_101702/g.242538 Transcript_101702/m.242538 type:complete len:221 (-) Transcript_101702:811-1473(-)
MHHHRVGPSDLAGVQHCHVEPLRGVLLDDELHCVLLHHLRHIQEHLVQKFRISRDILAEPLVKTELQEVALPLLSCQRHRLVVPASHPKADQVRCLGQRLHQLIGALAAYTVQRQQRQSRTLLLQDLPHVLVDLKDPRRAKALQLLPDPLLPRVLPHHGVDLEAFGRQELDQNLAHQTVGTIQDDAITSRELLGMLLDEQASSPDGLRQCHVRNGQRRVG